MSGKQEHTNRMNRRKLLALLGIGGAALASGGVTALAVGAPANPHAKAQASPITIAELRAINSPLPGSALFIVTDEGREGLFIYDSSDTSAADDNGTVIVSASGLRFKRIVENGTVHVPWFGAKGDGKTDDTAAFQAALAYGGPGVKTTVVVPGGDYLLTKELVIESYTDFVLSKNARLIRGHKGNIARNYDIKKATAGGYTGNSHIRITGGIFDCNCDAFPSVCNGIGLAHGEDLTLREVTIKDTYDGHALELSGVRDVLVDHCSFIGYKTEKKELYYVEAIQIEHTGKNFSGWIGDNTPTKDVVVTRCYFGASGTPGTIPWQAGVASHGSAYKVWADNIQVSRCIFDKQSYWGVRPFRWRRSIITGNLFTEGGGVFITMPGFGSESSKDVNGVPQPVDPTTDIIVENNFFYSMTKYAVYCEGDAKVYTERIIIKDNVIDTVNKDSAILATKTNGCIIIGNIIKGVDAGHGIKLDKGDCYVVDNNIISGVKSNGMIVSSAGNSRLSNNRIDGSGNHGMNLFQNHTMDVLNNKISDVSQEKEGAYNGIVMADSTDIRVIGNSVRTSSEAKKPGYGLLVQNTVTQLTRYGNDFRCGAVNDGLKDLSTNAVTSPIDLSS